MEKGRLIVFEGACDGIGKSTQIKLLREKLEAEGNIVVGHHFPTYGTYHGAPVEAYLEQLVICLHTLLIVCMQ